MLPIEDRRILRWSKSGDEAVEQEEPLVELVVAPHDVALAEELRKELQLVVVVVKAVPVKRMVALEDVRPVVELEDLHRFLEVDHRIDRVVFDAEELEVFPIDVERVFLVHADELVAL